MKRRTAWVIIGLVAIAPAPAMGQEDCPSGAAPLGHLGITIGCDCTVSANPTDSRPWQFRSPIRVAAVEPGGAAAGKLRSGDRIVAVDGARITTAEGARRLATLRPGAATALTVVRDGDTVVVRLTADAICPNDPRAIGSYAPALERSSGEAAPAPADRTPTAAVRSTATSMGPVPLMADLLPAGRLGFALACTGCGWERADDDTHPRWHSAAPPRVYAVEPNGPAAAAGLRPGDVLVQVDGLPITAAGGAALGAARPGQPLRLGIRRDRQPLELVLTPGRPAQQGAVRDRYDGSFGGVDVNVRSSAPASVSVNGAGDEMTIRVHGTVVRIRVPRADGER